MLPFSITFKSGVPVYTQVVYAAIRAMVSGQMRPGDVFPSTRTLSQELRINPNTAQKVVATLKDKRLLEVKPGIGTVVASKPIVDKRERILLLREDTEQLVVEALRLGMDLEELVDALREHWARLSKEKP